MREVPNADSAELSLNDIVATGKPLAAFVEVLSAKQMRMEFEPTSVGPSEIDYMIFYSIVEVGDNLFFALGESKLTSDVTIDNRRRLDFGPTNVVDSYVIVNPTQAHREQAQNNYQRYVEMREQKTRVITIGEVWAFSQSTQIQSDAGQTSA